MLPSGIILKLKRDQYGRAAMYRARPVARGNFHPDGSSYVELYTPIACIELVRVILAVAAALGWEVEHVDIKGAFLHADLPDSERIVIRLPNIDGLNTASVQYVRLKKSLYWLR